MLHKIITSLLIFILIFNIGAIINTKADFTPYSTLSFGGSFSETSTPFTNYATLPFSCYADIQVFAASINVTINGSTGIEETNATLFGYLTSNNSNDTTCWFQLKNHSTDFATPDVNTSVGVQPQSTLFSLNATSLSNGSLYYFRSGANSSEGWSYSWNNSYFLTKPQTPTNMAIANISGGFNITWTHGMGYNNSILIRSDDHYPQTVIDGDQVYYGPDAYYEDLAVSFGTRYYYRVWEYTYWDSPAIDQYSDGNESKSEIFLTYVPIFSNESPLNNSLDVSASLTSWNVTIISYVGLFNWTIQSSIGSNQSNWSDNGSKQLDFVSLVYDVTYTIWVNATVSNTSNTTNAIYYFSTAEQALVLYATLTIGGNAIITGINPVISSEVPTNTSIDIDMYPWLNITVTEPQGQNFNISWSTNATGSWIYWNSTCVTGGTYRQLATFANTSNTTYWWTVRVNDTDGNWVNETYHFTTALYTWSDWSDWWKFNYTCCGPTNLGATAYNQTVINLTWLICSDGADTNHLTRNASGWPHYPLFPTNGTTIYNGTNEWYNDTGLIKGMIYYYTIWGYNSTQNNYSLFNESVSVSTNGDIVLSVPYPANASTGNTRPPVNISINIAEGTDVNLTIYFYNMTPVPALRAWTKLYNWSLSTVDRYSVTNLSTLNGTTQFSWGNTRYNWSVNATDGTSWTNYTYYYTTVSTATGSNARMDVNNDSVVDVSDLSVDWSKRDGVAVYDGLYDVDSSGEIDVSDLSIIWNNRSS